MSDVPYDYDYITFDEEPRSESLSLKIIPDRDTFKANDEIHLEFIIKNIDKYPIYLLINNAFSMFEVSDSASGMSISPDDLTPRSYQRNFVVDSDSFVLLRPGEDYTYRDDNPIYIKQDTNGVYWLEYRYLDRYPIPESGFTLTGALYGTESYDLKQVPGLDYSVELYDGYLRADLVIVYDDGVYRVGEKPPAASFYQPE